MLLQKRRVASARILPSEFSLPFIAETYNTSPKRACIWQKSDQRQFDHRFKEIILRSKHSAPLAELPRGKRSLEESDFVQSTGRRVQSMLRCPLVMTLVALLEHQLPLRSSTDSEEVRFDVSLLATKVQISTNRGRQSGSGTPTVLTVSSARTSSYS